MPERRERERERERESGSIKFREMSQNSLGEALKRRSTLDSAIESSAQQCTCVLLKKLAG